MERAVCDARSSPLVRLTLGIWLLMIHACLRFGDAQRTDIDSLSIDHNVVRGAMLADEGFVVRPALRVQCPRLYWPSPAWGWGWGHHYVVALLEWQAACRSTCMVEKLDFLLGKPGCDKPGLHGLWPTPMPYQPVPAPPPPVPSIGGGGAGTG